MPNTTAHALTDLSGRFLSVDDGFCAILRRGRQDIIGRTILELTVEKYRAINAYQLERLREQGVPFVIRKTYLCGDGHTQAVENAVSLLTDGSGNSVLAAAVTVLPDASRAEFAALVNVARILLEEQRARAAVDAGLTDRTWALLLAAYLLEAEGQSVWATDVSEAAGGDTQANLLRVWELVHAGALVVDGTAASLKLASLRISAAYSKTLERHLATTLTSLR